MVIAGARSSSRNNANDLQVVSLGEAHPRRFARADRLQVPLDHDKAGGKAQLLKKLVQRMVRWHLKSVTVRFDRNFFLIIHEDYEKCSKYFGAFNFRMKRGHELRIQVGSGTRAFCRTGVLTRSNQPNPSSAAVAPLLPERLTQKK